MAMHTNVTLSVTTSGKRISHAAVFTWAKVCGIRYRPLDLVHSTDKDSEIGKWSTLFYDLPYLAAEEIEDCFVMDIMSSAPDDAKCHQFALCRLYVRKLCVF
jgi:hypothetical protein